MSARKLTMILYRLCWLAFVALVLWKLVAEPPLPDWVTWVPAVVAISLLVARGRITNRRLRHVAAAVEVAPPVTGRWIALNSPGSKVPSHGTHAYGQSYAIDVVAEPEPGARPGFAWAWPVFRRNASFPGFGRPVLAVGDGTVVHASDGMRDHLSRNSPLSLAYLMLVEASARDMSGAGWVTGNHLVIDLGGGTYAMYAHLKRGSLTVRAGDTVRAGQVVARCGNSGNSTEPHLHFQLMDSPDPDVGHGIPFRWREVGVPRNGEAFTVQSLRPSRVETAP